MSLYRKYRPQRFADLVGQHYVNQTLVNAVQLERIHHAYLFTGPRGTGKTSTARILAKAINCLNVQEGEPCNSCEICQDIQDGRLIDLIEIDAASNRGIDEIRDLKEKIQFAPTRAQSKVYIIDEVHMLTKEAFNALLKTLEEPPTHVYFILATTEAHKIPETILSRCQRFDFRRIEDGVIVEQLTFIAEKEGVKTEVKALEIIARQSQGGLRDAIGLLEQLAQQGSLSYEQACSTLGVSDLASLEHLYGFLQHCQLAEAMEELHGLYRQGYDLVIFHKNFLEYLRQQMLKSINANDTKTTLWLLRAIENFRETYEQVKQTVIPQLPLELAMVRSCLQETRETTSSSNPSPTITPKPSIGPQSEPKTLPNMTKLGTTPKSESPRPVTPPSPPPAASELKTEIAEKDVQPSVNLSKDPVTFERLQSMWPRVVEHVASAIAKRTLQTGTLLRLEETTIVVGFPSSFHYEKIMETANRMAVEDAAATILGGNFKLSGEVRTLAATLGNADRIAQPEKLRPKSPDTSLSEEALKIFEGEMME